MTTTNHLPLSILTLSLFTLPLLTASPEARAQTCTPPSSYIQTILGDKMSDSTFVNVYWTAKWNAGAAGDITRSAMDSFTKAVIQSDYFKASARNYGTGTPAFGGSAVDDKTPFPPLSTPMDIVYMSNEVNQALRTFFPKTKNPVVNLIVPAGSMVKNIADKDCNAGNFTAFHTKANGTSTPFTVIPLNPRCVSNESLDKVATGMTHEMVETITDPGFFGYMHLNTLLGPKFGQGEVGDVCDDGDGTAVARTSPLPFLGLHVDPYYSNDDCGCGPLWNSPINHFDPLPVMTDGVTAFMALRGSGFGTLPAGFSLPLTGNTPYLQLHVTHGSTELFWAGNSLHGGGDSQGVALTGWSPSEVDASIPGSLLHACDVVDLTVWDPKGGSTAKAQATFAAPSQLRLTTAPSCSAGVAQTIFGEALDASGTGVSGVPIQLSGGPGTLSATSVTTDATGRFTVTFTPAAEVPVSITASADNCAGGQVTATTGICQCGVYEQPCCDGSQCNDASLACDAGNHLCLAACGHQDQQCCHTASDARPPTHDGTDIGWCYGGGTCVGDDCACGGQNQACCLHGSACSPGLSCANLICQRLRSDQPTCGQCASNLTRCLQGCTHDSTHAAQCQCLCENAACDCRMQGGCSLSCPIQSCGGF